MIGPSIVIKGTVSGDEDLLVQGRVEGSIELKDNEVSVGQSGRVTADVDAKVVKIDGEVTGDISGAEKVVISKSGNVRGNIVAPRVTLEDEDGEEQRWRIVGPDEFDLSAGKLSVDSPMARSLLGKAVDDEVVVHSPSGEKSYYVVEVAY